MLNRVNDEVNCFRSDELQEPLIKSPRRDAVVPSRKTSPLWSAVTCHRFGLRRLDAAVFQQLQANHGRDWSRPTKALTGQRTPKSWSFLMPTCHIIQISDKLKSLSDSNLCESIRIL